MVAENVGQPAVATRDKKRVPRLEGIRGLCALGVIVTHVAFSTGVVLGSEAGPPQQGIWSILVAGLEVCLGPFFILSGMLLYRPFARATIAGRKWPSVGPYFLRRALRLLPPYWLLAVVCLLLLNFSSIHSAWYVLRPILLMQDYDYVWYAGMDPTWTVPTEAQFYILLPLVGLLMARLGRGAADPAARGRRMLIPIGFLLLVGFAFTAYMHAPSLGVWPTVYWWPFSRIGLFGLGMGLAVLTSVAEASPEKTPGLLRFAGRRPNLFWVAALAMYGVNCLAPFGHRGTWDYGSIPFALVQHVAFLSFAFLAVVPLVAPKAQSRLMEGLLSNRPMRFLGRISYGMYLWHFAVMYFWFRSGSIFGAPPKLAFFLIGTVGFWEMVTVVVLGTIAVAALSYYFFERPIIMWGERLTRGRKKEPVVAPIAAGNFAPPEQDERKSA